MATASRRSYQARFLLATVPLVIVFNVLSGFIANHVLRSTVDSEIRNKVTSLRETVPPLLAVPLDSQHFDQIDQLLGSFITDVDVARVTVRDRNGGVIASIRGTAALTETEQFAVPIELALADGRSVTVGSFEAMVSHARAWDQVLQPTIEMTGARLIAGLVLIGIMVWINRRLVVRPLAMLEKAIADSKADGDKHLVEWNSDDEIGRAIEAFNGMQRRLEDAEQRRMATNERLDRLYNGTPAMLHSVDRYGVIVHVSDHWLVATGYAREEVLGRPLDEFLSAESAIAYHRRILPNFLATGLTDDEPLRLICRSGAIMDVMLAAIVDAGGPEGDVSLSVMTDITDIKVAERELKRIASTDPVSDLYNRRGFLFAVDRALAQLTDNSGQGAVFYLDLDRFKRVNDTFGHAAGDRLLRVIGARLKVVFGERALVGRLGGDEFAAFVPLTPTDHTDRIVEQALDSLRRPVDLDGTTVEPSGSIGIAHFPADGGDAAALLHAADLALYRAKNDGRDRAQHFDRRLVEVVAARREQETDIRNGLANGWFELFVQPIVRLSDGRIVGGEALVRLRHPQKGLVPPGRFIPAAEETGLIRPLGRFILREAVRRIPALVEANGGGAFYLSVNLSGSQVTESLPEFLEQLLEENNVPASRLVLEIMETALLDDAEKVNGILARVSALGIRFALDDFGTGYSSLNYVSRFRVDMIKIDRSFTSRLTETSVEARRVTALVKTSVTLGQELGLSLVAEGIETAAELDRTCDLGIEYGQGYLFSPPLPLGDFVKLAEVNSARPGRKDVEAARALAS